jgi:hypothetical protein
VASPVAARHRGAPDQRETVSEQGETGEIPGTSVRLRRRSDRVEVRWQMPTPEPGSYEYPTADQIPEGAPPHPEVVAGSADQPEVFTLWAFVFNDPTACTDPCNIDDIGDTPARGGIFQLDHIVGSTNKIEMGGRIYVSELALLGAPLDDPSNAEIHIAMAPHGAARHGAELSRQFNGAIGGPPHWWAAIFEPDTRPPSSGAPDTGRR